MQILKTLKYTFSIILILLSLVSYSQKREWHSLMVGADLSRFIVPIVDNTRYGWEISGTYEFMPDVFAKAEFGTQTTRFEEPRYHYHSNGAYTRLGVNYNYMKHIDPASSDKLFIGAMYGFTTFFQEADNIVLSSSIWNGIENASIDRHWLAANWLEISTGMQAHIIQNFYLGWSVRFRINIWQQNNPFMQPYYVPGYGRAWSNSWVGFNYSIYYRIPFLRRRNNTEVLD